MGKASKNVISFEASNIPYKSLDDYLFICFCFFPIILLII